MTVHVKIILIGDGVLVTFFFEGLYITGRCHRYSMVLTNQPATTLK